MAVDRIGILGAVRTALLADTGVTDLLGDRLYLLQAPPDTDAPQSMYAVTESVTTSASNTSNEDEGAIMTLSLGVWGAYADGPARVIQASDAINAVLNCWHNDSYKVLAATRRTGTGLMIVSGSYTDRSTYRFLVNH